MAVTTAFPNGGAVLQSGLMRPLERFRTSARRPIHVPVIVKGEDWTNRKANLVDLSLKGACLEFSDAVVPGLDILLEVRSPMLWDPLELRGKVVWSHWNNRTGLTQAGIRFEYDSPIPLYSLFELLCSQAFDC